MEQSGQPIPVIKSKPFRVVDSSLTQDDRLMNLLSTYYPVNLDDEDSYSEKLTWCLEHCRHKFRDIKIAKGRVWYFQNEQDASMFALKWS